MPAVDILLTSPAANADRAETAPVNSGSTSAGDDFANAMKKALAPKEKSSPDKSAPREPRSGVARDARPPKVLAGESAPEISTATATDEVPATAAKAATPVSKDAINDEVKPAPTLPESLFPIIEVVPATPIFLTVPLSGAFTPPPVVTVASPANANPAAANVLAGAPAPTASAAPLPAPIAPVMSTLGPETLPVSSNHFSSEPALAQTLVAEPKSEKNFAPSPQATPSAVPKDATPGNFVLPAAQFVPVAEAATTPENIALPTEAATAVLKEMTTAANAEAPAVNAGTGVATTGSVMKKADKTTKIAGLDVQILPGAGQESPRESVLMPRVAVAAVRAIENFSSEFSTAYSGGDTNSYMPSPSAVAAAFNPVELPSLSDARLKSMERTHDMVALHAMRLVESKSDVLSVVIKPAVGTELTLELRQREGGVEAQAMLSRGDYQFLNQHWPELQQRLEQRGIKLAPLGGETNFSQNDNQQQQRSARDEAAMESAAAFAEFAAVGGATARRALSLNGWESWA